MSVQFGWGGAGATVDAINRGDGRGIFVKEAATRCVVRQIGRGRELGGWGGLGPLGVGVVGGIGLGARSVCEGSDIGVQVGVEGNFIGEGAIEFL